MRLPILLLDVGFTEVLVIVGLGIVLFGRRLPEVGRTLGKSFSQFRASVQDLKIDLREMERMADQAAAKKPRDVEARTVDAKSAGDPGSKPETEPDQSSSRGEV